MVVNSIWIIGALIAIWGIVAVIMPNWMKAFIKSISKARIVYLNIAVKVGVGVLFLIFARECNIPWLILAIGVLTAGGSILFCLLPYAKIQAYLQWWLKQPLWLYRVWGVAAAAFGGLIMYAGVPEIPQQAAYFMVTPFFT